MSPQLRIAIAVVLGAVLVVGVTWAVWRVFARRRLLADDSGLLADCMRLMVASEPAGKPWSDRDLSRMLTAEFGLPVRKRDVIQLRRLLHIAGPESRAKAAPPAE
ncbi:MAG: hypothetical protein AB7K09_26325 [Planctomycetota bacterium]